RKRMGIDGVLARPDALNLKLPLGVRSLFTRPPSAHYASVLGRRAVENHNPFCRLSRVGIHDTPADLVSLLCNDAGNIHIGVFKALLNLDRLGLRLVGHPWIESLGIR